MLVSITVSLQLFCGLKTLMVNSGFLKYLCGKKDLGKRFNIVLTENTSSKKYEDMMT